MPLDHRSMTGVWVGDKTWMISILACPQNTIWHYWVANPIWLRMLLDFSGHESICFPRNVTQWRGRNEQSLRRHLHKFTPYFSLEDIKPYDGKINRSIITDHYSVHEKQCITAHTVGHQRHKSQTLWAKEGSTYFDYNDSSLFNFNKPNIYLLCGQCYPPIYTSGSEALSKPQ